MTLKERFISSIKRGTGEAYLILLSNPDVDFSGEIMKGAVRTYAYDPQCEPSRGNYIAGLIKLSVKSESIVRAVLKAIYTEKIDTWNLVQLFEIAAVFAEEGSKEAKKAIYQRYGKDITFGAPWVGEKQIIKLDGIKGLLKIAEVRGKALKKDPDEWEDGEIVERFIEKNPAIDAFGYLDKEAENNLYVRKYLEAVNAHKGKIKIERPIQIIKYEVVKDRIERKVTVPLSPFQTKQLLADDINKLANDFLKEKIRLKKEKYLRIFSYVKFPFDYQPILVEAKSKYNPKDRVVEYAVKALNFFSGEDIRALVLANINDEKLAYLYVPLFKRNYKRGDYKLLKELVDQTNIQWKIHSLAVDYIDIYNSNPTKECNEPLEALYDKLRCSNHREDLVRIMIKNDVLNERIKEEIKYDCDEDVRNLYPK